MSGLIEERINISVSGKAILKAKVRELSDIIEKLTDWKLSKKK